jgi:transcriptional regulator with AAA-type ATPase domain
MFEEIVGSSEPLRRVLSQVSKVAPTDSTVLILGETGTGSEGFSRALGGFKKLTLTRCEGRTNSILPCVTFDPRAIANWLRGQ